MTQLPVIHADIWGDDITPTQSYYTVHVYRHDGMGNVATYTNIRAISPRDATASVASMHTHLRFNPMYAIEQTGRV